MGADVVVGSSQRFGAPLGYGGPHAAFIAVSEKLKRLCPGRIVGISRDSAGDPAMRLVLQTREQHVKRERATSNICTSQTLYANVSAFYAMYHGPTGLKQLAAEIHTKAKVLAVGLASLGYRITNERYFDTITFSMMDRDITAEMYYLQCAKKGVNVFMDALSQSISISVDEVTTEHHIACVLEAAGMSSPNIHALSRVASSMSVISSELVRTSDYLQGLAFKSYKSETELMRYIQHLQRKDFSLVHGMMPLGSCTMKLNPAAALRAFLWPEFSALHPFAPDDQARGYSSMIVDFKQKMCDITGMAACSIQPNSGAQGEYAGLRIIQAYHKSRGESHRNICLIPESAHGTNPASATLAGLKVVPVKCLDSGKIDMDDMRIKCTDYATELSCFMITYPSTHGIYDDDIIKMTHMVHANGGQCYMDGANLNAIIGYTGPGFIGVDACQLNLHKTFAVPHGGGGPGVGPIVVRQHLASFLPNSVMGPAVGGSRGYGTLSQCGYGSASLVTISYALLLLLGSRGLKTCTEYAVLNANYLKKRLEGHYPICFLGEKDYCAHEFIIDVRPLKQSARVSAQDIAKRLMDYGFHAPTVSFPITDTLMIEPTESESKRELDRFADAMISIRGEIAAIERGDAAPQNNVIKNAPHTAKMVTSDEWTYPYTRRLAAYPSRHQVADKFWPSVGRIEEVYGDRQMMCTCGPLEFYN